jgi:hypothetical protein
MTSITMLIGNSHVCQPNGTAALARTQADSPAVQA